jgi:hypothetical protein
MRGIMARHLSLNKLHETLLDPPPGQAFREHETAALQLAAL